MIYLKRIKLILAVGFFTAGSAQSQITISGPACVKPGLEYHYAVENNNQSSSGVRVCVRGGLIKEVTDSCISLGSSSVIKIIWTNASSGAVRVSANGTTQNLQVNITADLQPGEINTGSLQQLIAAGALPDTIKCSVARKGSCSPSYAYQWQMSADKIVWQNVPAASGRNLILVNAVNVPTYYRRKVTETSSGTVKYSGPAAVYINPRPN